jgi:hypothetical protein
VLPPAVFWDVGVRHHSRADHRQRTRCGAHPGHAGPGLHALRPRLSGPAHAPVVPARLENGSVAVPLDSAEVRR